MICSLIHHDQCDLYIIKNSFLETETSHEIFVGLENLFLLIKTSLKLGNYVYLTQEYPVTFPLINLEPKRLWVEKEKFIFLSPRAGFFLTKEVLQIQISSYEELERITQAWGK